MEQNNNVFSKKIKAGKRTYFVDIKEARNGGFYLAVAESRKRFQENGGASYEKSKVFIYPEDVGRFSEAIVEAFGRMKELMPTYDFGKFARRDAEQAEEDKQGVGAAN